MKGGVSDVSRKRGEGKEENEPSSSCLYLLFALLLLAAFLSFILRKREERCG